MDLDGDECSPNFRGSKSKFLIGYIIENLKNSV